ncbi:MAG TPA: acyl-CoA dehydrogenase family protein [Fimbriimonas sp.]
MAAADELVGRFSARAGESGDCDDFVAPNFLDMKEAGVFALHIPNELGGGGASYGETCDYLRRLAQACGSTALALSMHTHLVAALVWRWANQNAPVEGLLRRIAEHQLVLVSTGGNDWLDGSGTAEPVDGGYRVSGRKIFSSGCPAGDLLMTMAVLSAPEGPQVLHFPVDLHGEGVSIDETWRTLGMRGTGSNDIVLENVFVPESSVGVKRPQGQWHPSMHLVAKVALPLIYSVYTGLAERAAELAIQMAKRRAESEHTQIMAGHLRTEATATRVVWQRMVEIGANSAPGEETTDEVAMLRTLAARSALRAAELAKETAGGAAYFRKNELERVVRDLQAARYHPLQAYPQARYTGRRALGLGVD